MQSYHRAGSGGVLRGLRGRSRYDLNMAIDARIRGGALRFGRLAQGALHSLFPAA